MSHSGQGFPDTSLNQIVDFGFLDYGRLAGGLVDVELDDCDVVEFGAGGVVVVVELPVEDGVRACAVAGRGQLGEQQRAVRGAEPPAARRRHHPARNHQGSEAREVPRGAGVAGEGGQVWESEGV